jgi:hypothetical protein
VLKSEWKFLYLNRRHKEAGLKRLRKKLQGRAVPFTEEVPQGLKRVCENREKLQR